jgi:hypothetical protein
MPRVWVFATPGPVNAAAQCLQSQPEILLFVEMSRGMVIVYDYFFQGGRECPI